MWHVAKMVLSKVQRCSSIEGQVYMRSKMLGGNSFIVNGTVAEATCGGCERV